MLKRICVTAILAIALFQFGSHALAQTTSGVFSPNVKEGDKRASWRLAFRPGENGTRDRWSSRVHYQQALNDRLRARIVLSGDNSETGSFETTYLQAEMVWQFLKPTDTSNWASAFRFDYRFREGDDGRDFVRVNWTNQWNLTDQNAARFLTLIRKDVGNNAPDALNLELRYMIDHDINDKHSIAMHGFSSLGRTNNLGSFNDQSHLIGPALSGKFNDKIGYLFGPLFGISDDAPDLDIRFWLTQSF